MRVFISTLTLFFCLLAIGCGTETEDPEASPITSKSAETTITAGDEDPVSASGTITATFDRNLKTYDITTTGDVKSPVNGSKGDWAFAGGQITFTPETGNPSSITADKDPATLNEGDKLTLKWKVLASTGLIGPGRLQEVDEVFEAVLQF